MGRNDFTQQKNLRHLTFLGFHWQKIKYQKLALTNMSISYLKSLQYVVVPNLFRLAAPYKR